MREVWWTNRREFGRFDGPAAPAAIECLSQGMSGAGPVVNLALTRQREGRTFVSGASLDLIFNLRDRKPSRLYPSRCYIGKALDDYGRHASWPLSAKGRLCRLITTMSWNIIKKWPPWHVLVEMAQPGSAAKASVKHCVFLYASCFGA